MCTYTLSKSYVNELGISVFPAIFRNFVDWESTGNQTRQHFVGGANNINISPLFPPQSSVFQTASNNKTFKFSLPKQDSEKTNHKGY